MIWIFMIFHVWAQDVIIPSTETETIEFEQYMLEHPEQRSFIQDYLKTKVKYESDLLHLLKKAQYEFIDGSLQESQEDFKKIIDLRHEADWDNNQRQTILYSFFRLAQMSEKPEEQKNYLLSALSFDNQIPPDEKLFPPPLLVEYYKLKKHKDEKVWPLPSGSEKFKTILVNGVVLKNQGTFLKSLPGEKRFTFLSDLYAPVVMIDRVENIATRKINPIPMVQGTCENPRFDSSLKKENFLGFFSKDCILPSHLPSIEQIPISDVQEVPSLTENKKVQNYSPWLWVGIGIVTTAIAWKVLDDQNRQQPSAPLQPTQKHFSNSEAARY